MSAALPSPMPARPAFLRLLAASAALALLAACSLLPEAKPDPTRYFVLAGASGATTAPAGAPVVHIRPVEVANYLRPRAMVVRRGNHEIEFREYARWGEPLEQGIARALRGELLVRGAAAAITVGSTRTARLGSDVELAVRVLAFEGHAGGTASMHAVWELFHEKGLLHRGEFRSDSARWDGKNEASLAAALSEAVSALAADIAAALAKKP